MTSAPQPPAQCPVQSSARPLDIDRRAFLAILSAAAGTAAVASLAFPAGAAFSGAKSATGSAAGSAPEPPPHTVLVWTLLQPGFYAITDPSSGGNTLLVVSLELEKALLIDTKFPAYAEALKADAAALINADTSGDNFNLTLINTHHHADHTSGNPVIVPATVASYAHKNAIERIKSQFDSYVESAKNGPAQLKQLEPTDELLQLAQLAADTAPTWTPTTAIPKIAIDGSGSSLDIGEIPLKTHHFGPGHTDNDLIVHFPAHNIIHTGDLVFNGLHPYFDPAGGATVKGWISALTQLLELADEQTTIIPGHGPVAGPTKGRAAIQAQLDYMHELVAHVQAAIDKGDSKEDTAKMSWGFMDGLGFEQARERAINAVYDELDNG